MSPKAPRRRPGHREGLERSERDGTGCMSRSRTLRLNVPIHFGNLSACRASQVIDIEIEIEMEFGEGREACRSHADQGEGYGATPVLGSPFHPTFPVPVYS